MVGHLAGMLDQKAGLAHELTGLLGQHAQRALPSFVRVANFLVVVLVLEVLEVLFVEVVGQIALIVEEVVFQVVFWLTVAAHVGSIAAPLFEKERTPWPAAGASSASA